MTTALWTDTESVSGPGATGPLARHWHGGPLSTITRALALAAFYGFGAQLTFWFLSSPAHGAPFFPAAGVTLAFLVLTPTRRWPVWLTVVASVEILVDVANGQRLTMALGFAAANVIEPLFGAWAVRRTFFGHFVSFRRTLGSYLLWAVIAAPAVGAVVGATAAASTMPNAEWLPVAGRWWIGDALGVLVIATAVLAWAQNSPFEARATPLRLAGIALLAMGVTLVPIVAWDRPVFFAALPVLIWAALVGGSRAVTTAGIAVAFAADWATLTGRATDVLAPAIVGPQLVDVQIFLGLTLITALFFVAEVGDRRRGEAALWAAKAERQQQAVASAEAASAERRRVMADVHDIVGHSLNVVLLQAAAARRAAALGQPLADDVLESIESVSRRAFRDLDVALAIVEHPTGAEGRLAEVDDLIDAVRHTGIEVEVATVGVPCELPEAIDRAAYRVVQEALTNVVKHTTGAATVVRFEYGDDQFRLAVVDEAPGRLPAADQRQGRGLRGMRERVEGVGGRLIVEPDSPDGFAVIGRFPLDHRPS